MRTTVTLDPDVERMLCQAMRERGLSFKEALNESLRAGLRGRPQARKTFSQQTFSLGRAQLSRWDKPLATAAALEDEEILRKIALRK